MECEKVEVFVMLYADYRKLFRTVRTQADVDQLSASGEFDPELLLVVYTQRVVRDATSRFYLVKRHARRMFQNWKHGMPLVGLAHEFHFPAVLTAMIVMEENRISKKQFWRYLTNVEGIRDTRLREEFRDVLKEDIVYSPEGAARQFARGRWGEAQLQKWLDGQGILYQSEEELRPLYTKTPDALLASPIRLNGGEKFWFESKATFGDPVEIRRHVRRQLKPYSELFGPGLVVYWFGYVEDVVYDVPPGVTLANGEGFTKLRAEFDPTAAPSTPT